MRLRIAGEGARQFRERVPYPLDHILVEYREAIALTALLQLFFQETLQAAANSAVDARCRGGYRIGGIGEWLEMDEANELLRLDRVREEFLVKVLIGRFRQFLLVRDLGR